MNKGDYVNDRDTGDRLTSHSQAENITQSAMSEESITDLLAAFEVEQRSELFRRHLKSLLESDRVKIEDIDKHFLKGFLSYLNSLYTTGKIGEETYMSLVTQASESYAERLVESKIAKALEKYETYLGKASIPWFS